MKKYLTIAACCIGLSGALALNKSDAVSSKEPQYTESQILNFVLGLEHFQDAFYREGLKNFTQAQFANYGFDASFYSNLTEIASQEHTHVTYVTTELRRLKASPVAECKYNFNVTNPSVFVTTASLIESVSVSAYIDVLSQLRGSAFLKVFSSVLAVEARHSSFIRAALGNQPFASPYDTPIDLDEAHTLVELFTVSCPEDNPLGLKNYSTLSSSFSNFGAVGREVTFVTYGQDIKLKSDSDPLYAAFLTLMGPVFAPTIRLPNNGGFNTTIPTAPEGYPPLNGLTYVVLSSSNTCLTDDNIVAGPATIEVHRS